MKILLINNNTQHLESLSHALAGHDVEVQIYKPGLEFNQVGKDLVVLSGGGGEGLEIYDHFRPGKLWYEDEMDFVLRCQRPIIGICMGFEVIASAHGQKIQHYPNLIEGFHSLDSVGKGRRILEDKTLKQFESHYWRLHRAPKNFEVLAESVSGIEMMRHKTKPILATQFHPEKGGTLQLSQLVTSFA